MEKECMEEGRANTKRPLLPAETNFISSDKPNDGSSLTPVLFLSAIVALSGNFCFGFAAGYTSTAEFEMMEDLDMSIAAYSFFGSILTIGAAIGAILSGKIADFVGRKRTMWLSQIFFIMGWLGIASATSVWGINIGRVSIGFAVGLIAYVVPVYIAEITPKNIRGRLVVTLQLMNCSGLLIVFFLGNFFSWRTLSLLAIIPCLMQVVGLVFIPESPRWLASIGKETEFEDALRQLRGADAGVSEEATEIRDATEIFQRGDAGFQGLFQKKYAYPLMIGVGLMLLQQLGGNSVFAAYLSTVFAKANVSTTIGPTAIAFLQMPAAVLGVILMDAFGRRALLMVSSVASCLCLSTMGLAFYLQEHDYAKEFTPVLVFLGVLGFSYAFAVGMSGIPWVIMSEIFPINVKASAGSLVTLVNWSSSWLVTYAFNFMLEWSSPGTFFFFASISALAFLFTWIMVPETKGRSLEDIHASLITYVY
ncbi:hypothetical protein OIU85_004988 [Salix viminalis]|uniref:Major facilitator superfamily (MFS) profile domain-containing protein n=1 Tax=Salix viminalis TaxID=40686 RepID=A0A9Q0PTX2_SALVM|nr:hypothetical protein OIU85_004988 [Salix viminalis]